MKSAWPHQQGCSMCVFTHSFFSFNSSCVCCLLYAHRNSCSFLTGTSGMSPHLLLRTCPTGTQDTFCLINRCMSFLLRSCRLPSGRPAPCSSSSIKQARPACSRQAALRSSKCSCVRCLHALTADQPPPHLCRGHKCPYLQS